MSGNSGVVYFPRVWMGRLILSIILKDSGGVHIDLFDNSPGVSNEQTMHA